MKNQIRSLCILICLGLCQPIYAAANLNSKCEVARQIRHPAGSQGVIMSQDCRVAYVLPPTNGQAQVVGRTVGDLSRCSDMQSLSKALKILNKQTLEAISSNQAEAILKEIYQKRDDLISKYKEVAKLVGASLELNFNTGISENLNRYRNFNQSLPIEFNVISLKNTKLSWNQTESVDQDLKIAFNKSLPLSQTADAGAGSFSARLDLSLLGACQLRDDFTSEIPLKIDYRRVAGLITPNFQFDYEVQANYSYVAEYNLATLAKRIIENSTSGGLFKTSSRSSLVQTAESTGWFKFDMSCDDSRVCDQAKIEKAIEVKQRLVGEVLRSISYTTMGAVAPPVATEPGRSGATVAAEALRTKCADAYCQVGAVVLDVANSIFGGSGKTESFIATQDHIAKEEVSQKLPVSFSGVMGFSR